MRLANSQLLHTYLIFFIFLHAFVYIYFIFPEIPDLSPLRGLYTTGSVQAIAPSLPLGRAPELLSASGHLLCIDGIRMKISKNLKYI